MTSLIQVQVYGRIMGSKYSHRAPAGDTIPPWIKRQHTSFSGLQKHGEAADSVRKFQLRPWPFYAQKGSEDGGDYILSDSSRSQKYKLNFPDLNKFHRFSHSRDGWLLVLKCEPSALFLPKLPDNFSGQHVAFSAPPTSSCLVVSLDYITLFSYILINTWRPGETVWTTYRFENQWTTYRFENKLRLDKCVFSNGLFYCLKQPWSNLPIKPYPGGFDSPMLMTEHEGDIFVISTRDKKNPLVFKLNLNGKVWEETRDLGGLTVFASFSVSLTRAGLPSEMRNRIYTWQIDDYGRHDRYYYSLGDEKSSRPSMLVLHCRMVWVDPPHNVKL